MILISRMKVRDHEQRVKVTVKQKSWDKGVELSEIMCKSESESESKERE